MKTPDLTFLLNDKAGDLLIQYQCARRKDTSVFVIEKARKVLSKEEYDDFCFCIEIFERMRNTQPKPSPAG